MRNPSHRSEQTGDAGLDRIQSNVRDLIARVNVLLSGLARTHGMGLKHVVMRDETYRLTSGEIEGAFIVIDGPLTAARDVIVPRATDVQGYGRWFDNRTGQDLNILNEDGSTSLPAATGTAFIVVSADGPWSFA